MKFTSNKQRKAVMAKLRELKGVIQPVPTQKYVGEYEQNKIIKRPYTIKAIKAAGLPRVVPPRVKVQGKPDVTIDRYSPEYIKKTNELRKRVNREIILNAKAKAVYDTSKKKFKQKVAVRHLSNPAIAHSLATKGELATKKLLDDYEHVYTFELIKKYIKPENQKQIARMPQKQVRQQLFKYWYADKDKSKFTKADIKKPSKPMFLTMIPARRREYEAKVDEYEAYKNLWRR